MDGHYLIPWFFFRVTLGTVTATPCPQGTARNQTGAAAVGDCWPCPPGYYCDQEPGFGPSGVCLERYYCPDYANIKSEAPSSFQCPTGHYCPKKTGIPIGCPPGKHLAM